MNTTDSAVRITHAPTGIVVSMQDEKSQLQNREKAMRVLRARIYERALEEQQAEIAAERRSQVGTGQRAEKVRTYNVPQGRVTDHRIKLTAHNLDEVLAGDLSEFTSALSAEEKRARLEAQTATRMTPVAAPGRRRARLGAAARRSTPSPPPGSRARASTPSSCSRERRAAAARGCRRSRAWGRCAGGARVRRDGSAPGAP